MLSRELPPPSRNPLLETNPISSPSNKFKSFSKDIDRDLSQEYIRRQLYAYGILHTQSNSVSGSAGNLAGSALSKRAGGQRGEGALEIDSELLAWKQFRTTQVVPYLPLPSPPLSFSLYLCVGVQLLLLFVVRWCTRR